MTDRNELQNLRTLAKQLGRGRRVPHHQALNIVATRCGHPHWKALTGAWEKGWRPTPEQLALFSGRGEAPRESRFGDVYDGTIHGVPYELTIGEDFAAVSGNGWSVYLGHAPSEAARLEVYRKPSPLDDGAFLAEVMKIANAAADEVRAGISRRWPRSSTKPDAQGCTAHPLSYGVSAEWHCLHCDAKSTGAQMAANMWHCPQCSAAPTDIHATAWWNEKV